MRRRPPRSTQSRSSAASDVYKRQLYIYEGPKRGIVHLVKATPEGFQRAGLFTVTEGDGNHWAHPAIANGVLYIRHGDVLLAYNLRPAS